MSQSNPGIQLSQRNYGIDLLRLVAAFYVIVLHTLNHGGVYYPTIPDSRQELLCRFLFVTAFCAVNIFGIISGYVGYREPQKKISYSGYLPLWLTVVFYGVLFWGIYRCILPGSVTLWDLVMSFFPVTANLYWYFSAYSLVFFLAPFLNRILCSSSDQELKLLLFLICCVLVPIEYIGEPFALDGGYSAIWLLMLYLVGGIMKKTGIGKKLPASAALLLIILIDVGFFCIGRKWTVLSLSIFHFNLDVRSSYVTPVYLATAILHVILFSKLKIFPMGEKIIRFAAPAAFSVYIANTSPLFWKYSMANRFASWAVSSPAGILGRTFLFSWLFVTAVIFMDFFRQKLFRLMGIGNRIPKQAFSRKD